MIAYDLPKRDEPSSTTDVEGANRAFLELVRSIPGVMRVEHPSSAPAARWSFRVFVTPDSGAREKVYGLEGQLFDTYPDALLDVWVSDER